MGFPQQLPRLPSHPSPLHQVHRLRNRIERGYTVEYVECILRVLLSVGTQKLVRPRGDVFKGRKALAVNQYLSIKVLPIHNTK